MESGNLVAKNYILIIRTPTLLLPRLLHQIYQYSSIIAGVFTAILTVVALHTLYILLLTFIAQHVVHHCGEN